MFKLRCEWGFILYFVVMQQTIFFSTRVATNFDTSRKKNAQCTEAYE